MENPRYFYVIFACKRSAKSEQFVDQFQQSLVDDHREISYTTQTVHLQCSIIMFWLKLEKWETYLTYVLKIVFSSFQKTFYNVL